MKARFSRPASARVLLLALVLVNGPIGGAGISKEIEPADRDFFEKDVRPILIQRCFECHGPDSDEGEAGLRLDSLAGMIQGGRSGPAIEPGQPRRSLLVLAINHDPAVTGMPPKTRLPRREVAMLTRWVKMGAPWPNAQLREPQRKPSKENDRFTDEERSFWAFIPVVKPALPDVHDVTWATEPLDLFVLSGLEVAGIRPAPRASRRTLIRRATLDLLGLPPTPEEVDAFLADDSPQAYARLVDRLLASPRYGERWGRHWLDVARYADSNGMDDNMAYVDAWRYRDYVIAAFNKDKPYDQFVREQIAGDLLSPQDETDWDTTHEGKTATGFLMIGPKMLAEDDPVKQQMDIVDDQIDTIGRAFMGLTFGCARCHDHKFDPIRTADYYALAGIFKSTRTMLSYRVDSKWNSRALGSAEQERRLEELEQQIDRLDEAVVLGNFVGKEDEKKRLTERLAEAKRKYGSIPKTMAAEEGQVDDLQVFLRGNHLTRGPLVSRGIPRLFAGHSHVQMPRQQSGRLELANWLARPDHPITARVMVNRIWQGHFGEGLVRSPDNLGRLGQRPDHPALLDWLAATFSESWSVKSLHRKIMLSSTYQLSTTFDAGAAAIDPENRLLWRMNHRRLEAELIRDSLLALSGRLDRAMGGPALPKINAYTILSASALKDANRYDSTRRSVYLPVLRSGLYDVFQAFDFPDPAVVSGRRASTIVAPQALFMMNGKLMRDASLDLASMLIHNYDSWDQRVDSAYESAYSRSPTETELADWRNFFESYRELAASDADDPQSRELQAWQSFCRVLLSSNEFVFVE